MPCLELHDENGHVNGFACTRGQRRPPTCWACPMPSTTLCDGLTEPLTFGSRPATCDRPMCDQHRTQAGRNTDYCADHASAVAHP